jgi:hypothetical protein
LTQYTDDDYPINELAAADLPDERLVLAAAREDGFSSWDARTGEPLSEPNESDTIWAMASGILPDRRASFLGAGNDHLVYRWDAGVCGSGTAGRPPQQREGRGDIHPAGRHAVVVSGGDDYTVRL